MAIYAQRTAFRSTAQFPDFKVTSPIDPCDFLVYDAALRAFINIPASSIGGIIGVTPGGGGGPGTGSINDGVNLGTGEGIFESALGDELQFKSLIAGPGISLASSSTEIEISNSLLTDACISVEDSFKIVIDDDNTTVDTAMFCIYTNDNPADVTLLPIATYSAPNLDITVVTDITFTNPGQFVSTTADFTALGFVAGMCLRATGTTEQDGVWKIASVDTTTNPNDTLTITVSFPDPTDAGFQPPTLLEAMYFELTGLQTIVMFGRDVVVDGFVAGQTFALTGTTDNDGTYTVATATGDTLTIVEVFPGTLGCDVGTISLVVPAEIIPTGFCVNEKGEVNANDTTICGDLEVICDGNLHVEGDTILDGNLDVGLDLTVGGILLEDIIISFLPVFPTDGILVQTSSGVFDAREIEVNPGLTITNADGIAGNPNIDVNDFDITLTGAVTGTATVTDLGDVIISTTSSNSGVIAGVYNKVTVSTSGLVTFGENQPIVGSAGIIVTNGDGVAGNPTITAADFNITIDGDSSGSGTVTELGDVTITLDHSPSGVIAATYNKVTVDAKGRVIIGQNQPIIGGSGIVVVNGDGTAGNPTISADDFDLTFTGSVTGTGTVIALTDTVIDLELEDITVAATYNEVTIDSKGRVVSGINVPLDFQPLSATLTDLADGMDNPGYVVWNGATYVDRTIAGTLNQIVIVDGDATTQTEIGLANNVILPGTESITVPKGTIAQRPGAPINGMLRYRFDDQLFEGYVDGSWQPFLNAEVGDYLPIIGGTMQGSIDMDGFDLLNPGTVDGRIVADDGVVLDAINTGTGIKVQVGPGTFENREIEADIGSGITVSDGDGVAANPSIGFDPALLDEVVPGTKLDECEDMVLVVRDGEPNKVIRAPVSTIRSQDALRFFMVQI